MHLSVAEFHYYDEAKSFLLITLYYLSAVLHMIFDNRLKALAVVAAAVFIHISHCSLKHRPKLNLLLKNLINSRSLLLVASDFLSLPEFFGLMWLFHYLQVPGRNYPVSGGEMRFSSGCVSRICIM